MQGPTLVIVRSATGHTFGGYASAAWNSGGNYINAAGCFLFLVENPHGDAPTCFECNDNANAMYGYPSHGPTFGGGHDIHISDNGASSYTGFPCSYTDTLGRARATFTGDEDFTPEDYEVWAAT
jgi:hypothetical protein